MRVDGLELDRLHPSDQLHTAIAWLAKNTPAKWGQDPELTKFQAEHAEAVERRFNELGEQLGLGRRQMSPEEKRARLKAIDDYL